MRPIAREEVDIFFGRDDHVDEMLDKLAANHFLCITGPSGCGKSSLAKTGLLTALEAGFLSGGGSDWIFVDIRPGNQPLRMLCQGYAQALMEAGNSDLEHSHIETILGHYIDQQHRDLGNIPELRGAVDNRSILILVDQFEEIFRFNQNGSNDVRVFVDVLLKTIAAKRNVYVAITMRTDELEKCARFPGLTAAINSGQFLTPVLDRYQLQEVIDGPIGVFGGSIDQDLSIWLLNNCEEMLDKLPILQHCLRLLYFRKLRETEGDATPTVTIGLSDLAVAFGFNLRDLQDPVKGRELLRQSISKELDRVYFSLPDKLRLLARHLFCDLTEMGVKGRDIRRPRTIAQLAASAGVDAGSIRAVLDPFVKGDIAYLYESPSGSDPKDSVVDVPHECVLRLWERLQYIWLPEEHRRADDMKMLVNQARRFDDSKRRGSLYARLLGGGMLGGSQLYPYSDWFGKKRPREEWARRYIEPVDWEIAENSEATVNIRQRTIGEKFTGAFGFLEWSCYRHRAVLVGVVVTILGGAVYVANDMRYRIDQANNMAFSPYDLRNLFVEERDEYGATLYLDSRQRQIVQPVGPSLLEKIKERNEVYWNIEKLAAAVNQPLCNHLDTIDDLTALGTNNLGFCKRYPPVNPETGMARKKLPKHEAAKSVAKTMVGKDFQMEARKLARGLLYSLSAIYPSDPDLYEHLATGFRLDENIPDDRRFAEVNACHRRQIAEACKMKMTDDGAHKLYVGFGDYADGFLETFKAGGKKLMLSQDYVALKAMLSAEFLDEETVNPAGADADASANAERMSRLWRGFDSASDAARGLYRQFQCRGTTSSETRHEACAIADKLYERAARALKLVIEIGNQNPDDPPKHKQFAYGAGLGGLHWSQDPDFRRIAGDVGVKQEMLIKEVDRASRVSSGSNRYPTALAMLYCLNGDFDEAKRTAYAIRSFDPKYDDVRQKAEHCDQVSEHEMKHLFTRRNPSE